MTRALLQIGVAQVDFGGFAARHAREDVHHAFGAEVGGRVGDDGRHGGHDEDVIEAFCLERRHLLGVFFLVHRIKADEVDALALGFQAEAGAEIVEALVADVGADDGGRAVFGLDGGLDVHPSHRAARADEPGFAARLERRPRGHVAVGFGDVGARCRRCRASGCSGCGPRPS